MRKSVMSSGSYTATVRGDVPANLAERVQAAHAAAIRATNNKPGSHGCRACSCAC